MEFTEDSGDRVIINFDRVCSILEHKRLNESSIMFDSGISIAYGIPYEVLSEAFGKYCANKCYFTQPIQINPYIPYGSGEPSWKDPNTGNPFIYCGNTSDKADK